MKVTIENIKGLNKEVKVFIDKKTMNTYMDEKYDEIKNTVNLKGFRPGKVPKEVLKRQFGKAIFGEVLDKVLKDTSSKALEENKIKPAGQPKLDLKVYGEDKDLEYVLSVTELPKVEIKSVENIKFDKYHVKIDDAETDKRIKEIAKSQNNFKEVSPEIKSTNGNLVVFDYKATIDNKEFSGGEGKNTQLILGKDLFIKGFDKNLIGVKKNDEKIVSCILPDNYPKNEYANKKADFKCKILMIKKPESIKIDDIFAKNLGAKDLKDLRLLVSRQIQNEYKNNLGSISKENILDQIEKMHDFDLPSNLIEQELSIITKGIKKEDFEKNNLKISEQEFKNEIQKQIQSMPGQEKQIMEYYQKNPSATNSLRGSLYEEKIINLIKEKSNKSKKIVSLDEAEKILKLDHDKRHDHNHKHSKASVKKATIKKPKKVAKSSNIKK